MTPFAGLTGFGGGPTGLALGGGALGTGTWYGGRGLAYAGQNQSGKINVIDYFTIATTGNASDFGDATVARCRLNGGSNGSIGVAFGGYTSGNSNVIDYVTIGTTGNATDFGDLTSARDGGGSACDGNYGFFAGGNPGNFTAVIDYVSVTTPGNGADFGDLDVARYLTTGVNDLTSACMGAGDSATGGLHMNIIDYFTMATPGNATDFGDLSISRASPGSCSSSGGRGIFGGGYIDDSYNRTDNMEYITIATTGNGSDFGDLTHDPDTPAGCSNGSRGIFCGGYPNSPNSLTITYITIDGPVNNAVDFGDLNDGRWQHASFSGT